MACNECNQPAERCGCTDHPVNIPTTFSGDPSVCPQTDPCEETCSELFDMKCVYYDGPDICELDVKNGDRLEDVLQKILLSISTISCITPEQGPQGPQGDQGIQGVQGDAGTNGLDGEVNVIATNTLPPGSSATVTDSNPDPRIADLTFGIPKGDKGDKGDTGDSGVGVDLDFDTPDTTLELTNSNVAFNSVWSAVAYTSGSPTRYGYLRYWSVNANLAYVQWYMEWDARGNGGVLGVGNKGYTTAMIIQLTGLPFTPKNDVTYAFPATLQWDGKENNTDYALAGNVWQGSESVSMVYGGANVLQIDTSPTHYVPAVDTTYSAAKKWIFYYSGYVFKD